MKATARMEPRQAGLAGAEARPRVRNGIAVLVSRFPKLTETFVLREIDALEKAGVPVTLVPLIRHEGEPLHPAAAPWMERALWSGWLAPSTLRGAVRCLRRAPKASLGAIGTMLRGSLPGPGLTARTLTLLPKALHLAEELRRRGVGHVHAHFATHPTTVAWIIWRIAGIGYSFTAHAHDIFVDTRLLHVKVRDACFVRAISSHNARLLQSLAPDVPADRIRVLRLGVPTGERSASRAVSDVAMDRPPRLLAVAALRRYKGLDVLLDACALLRDRDVDVRCEIVGDGPERAALQARIRRLDLESRVELTGPLTEDEVAGRLRSADLFVHPSVVASSGQMDGIPIALMEAMAAGLPVVASDLSGIPELVTHGQDGLLAQPGDAAALAGAIHTLVGSPDLRRRLGQRAAMTVRTEFDLRKATERLAMALDEVNPPPPTLTGRLPMLLAASGWPVPDRIGIARARKGADSTTLELTVQPAGPTHRLLLKRHRERSSADRTATERAAHERDTLSLLKRRLASYPNLRVPSVVASEGDTILMTRCPGRPLDDSLRQGRWTRDRAQWKALGDSVLAAGKWLAAMHARCASTDRVSADGVAPLEQALRRDLAWLAAAETSLVPDSLSDGVDRVVALARDEPGASWTLRHGDFWPGNVLVSGDVVSVVDFEGARPGPGAWDVAYFLLHLERYFRWPGLGRRRRHLTQRFLLGYGDVPVPTLRLARMAVSARLLATATLRGSAPRFLVTGLRDAEEWSP